jgi:multidrug efflux pump
VPRPALPGAGSGLPVKFVIGSTRPSLEVNEVSQELVGRARESGLCVFVESDLKYDLPQVSIDVYRDKAAALGLSMREVGDNLSTMLGGGYLNWFSKLQRLQPLNSATLSAVPAPGVAMRRALDYLKQQAQALFPKGFSIGYVGQSRQYTR